MTKKEKIRTFLRQQELFPINSVFKERRRQSLEVHSLGHGLVFWILSISVFYVFTHLKKKYSSKTERKKEIDLKADRSWKKKRDN